MQRFISTSGAFALMLAINGHARAGDSLLLAGNGDARVQTLLDDGQADFELVAGHGGGHGGGHAAGGHASVSHAAIGHAAVGHVGVSHAAVGSRGAVAYRGAYYGGVNRGYAGYRGYAYRPYYGYRGSYGYRPYYRPYSYGYYRPYGYWPYPYYASYYSPYYYPSYYYPSYYPTYYDASPDYSYYGTNPISGTTLSMPGMTTLDSNQYVHPPLFQTPSSSPMMPPAGDGTFDYNGGPAQPMPMPGADGPAPMLDRKVPTVPLEGKIVAKPASQPATLSYTAYGASAAPATVRALPLRAVAATPAATPSYPAFGDR